MNVKNVSVRYGLLEQKRILDMKDEHAHTLEEQHTAMGTIAGFVYQFYYFLYKILTAEKGNTISFELYDDVATESQNGLTYCQLKHTVQQAASVGEKDVKLTDRASDLWKAISVWMKLIVGEEKDGIKRSNEEQSAYIAEREFHFVTNKSFAENKLAALCSRFERCCHLLRQCLESGARNAATFNTFIQTCKQVGVPFMSYFKKVMNELKNGRTDYQNLLPATIQL